DDVDASATGVHPGFDRLAVAAVEHGASGTDPRSCGCQRVGHDGTVGRDRETAMRSGGVGKRGDVFDVGENHFTAYLRSGLGTFPGEGSALAADPSSRSRASAAMPSCHLDYFITVLE